MSRRYFGADLLCFGLFSNANGTNDDSARPVGNDCFDALNKFVIEFAHGWNYDCDITGKYGWIDWLLCGSSKEVKGDRVDEYLEKLEYCQDQKGDKPGLQCDCR